MTEVEVAKKILNKLNTIDPTAESYMVGGCVRDMIMGIEPNDVDIATSISIDVIEKHFTCYDIGKNKDFCIVVVKEDGFDFEIANFRKDGEYTDGRHPDSVVIVNSFEEDSSRRDLTINLIV